MPWDKIFWFWFIFSAAVVILAYIQEPNPFSTMFGLLLAGLGFGKLAGEAGRDRLSKSLERQRPKLNRSLLKRLEKQGARKRQS